MGIENAKEWDIVSIGLHIEYKITVYVKIKKLLF